MFEKGQRQKKTLCPMKRIKQHFKKIKVGSTAKKVKAAAATGVYTRGNNYEF